MSDLNLGDIPDLSGIVDTQTSEPFQDGWYKGTILEKREFTDNTGSERVFESSDAPSQNGDSRNVRLQVEVKRQDGRTLNTNVLVNYQTEDLSQETVQAIAAAQATQEPGKKPQWGSLFRPFMALQQLGKLQKIAGVRQLQRNGNGGLDLTPLYGKTAFFKLGPDRRNPELYKEVKNFSATVGPKTKVL
jgi:hypothetical protein